MANWVLFRRSFWIVLVLGLAADWGSKALVNLTLQPVRWPTRPIADAPGNVFPFPPPFVSVAHVEHWFDRWPALDTWEGSSILSDIARLIDRATSRDYGDTAVFLLFSLGVAFWVAFLAVRMPPLRRRLSIGLALWFGALLGNQWEILLYGHATDWIWVNAWRMDFATNFADVASLAAELTILATLIEDMISRGAGRIERRRRKAAQQP